MNSKIGSHETAFQQFKTTYLERVAEIQETLLSAGLGATVADLVTVGTHLKNNTPMETADICLIIEGYQEIICVMPQHVSLITPLKELISCLLDYSKWWIHEFFFVPLLIEIVRMYNTASGIIHAGIVKHA